MKELLDYLRDQTVTLTVYNYEGSEEQLAALARTFSGTGVAVTKDTTGRGTPTNLGVLHRGDEVFGARPVDEWLADDDFETLLASGADTERERLPDLPSDGLTVAPETSRRQMVGVSRMFERRALRESEGTLVAGFQTLSTMRDSERTRSVYDRLAGTDVDVTVCGYPDIALEDPPFDIFEDSDGTFRDYWFLLFDGNGNDSRKAALVSREEESALYNSFWTDDPGTVDELFALLSETHPELLPGAEQPTNG
ncbi:DICT sensory domain-containing protein [Salinibaculum rarum]|uniref:DICT sensory domain-containing protein n=1 Tax=Salinibaculum rarum TaxID=3058903 RepID=UPI00265F73A5|nr:DICT sensory domain-containing protein [Salinibaculum sp. KK48]